MKKIIPLAMLSVLSASSAFAQTPCVNLSGKFVESTEHVSYPDGLTEDDAPVIIQTIQMSESADCSQVTFISADSTTGKPVQQTEYLDGVVRDPRDFNGASGTDADGNNKSGNLTFYSAFSATNTGFKVETFSSLNGEATISDNVIASYSLDQSGNLLYSTSYPDGVVITYTYKKAN